MMSTRPVNFLSPSPEKMTRLAGPKDYVRHTEMATDIVIAYDGSGSTGNCAEYHDQTQRIVQQYPNAKILFWDTTHRLISHAELAEINRHRKGFGGTSPSEIAIWARANNFHGHLIIITDGEVYVGGIDACSEILGKNWTFEYVTAHLIGGAVNMSVTCPFTRQSPHTVYLYEPATKYEQTQTTQVSPEDLELLTRLDAISTVSEFQTIAPTLERVLIARTMGTQGNMELRDVLLAMKTRLNVSISAAAGNSDAAVEFVSSVRSGNVDATLRSACQLTLDYYKDFDSDVSGVTWSSKLSRMIAMTEGALRGVFSMNAITAGIQSDRIRRAAAAAPASTPSTTSGPESESEMSTSRFECPITLNSERDVVLLVKAGEPILAGLEKRILDDILDCPLNLLKYSEVVANVIARLDHSVSLAAYAANTDGWSTSPITRSPLQPGAICFGAARDHVQATQYTLAQLFTGGKLAGNPDFWYACIWWILTQPGLCPEYLQMLHPFATEHMKWRLRNQATFIALSGLPEFPTTRVPLDCAIWYVLASPLFSAGCVAAGRDVLRGHLPHLQQLLELSKLAEHRFPKSEELQKHYIRLKTLLRYLAWIKADRHALPMWTRMLVQDHLRLDFETFTKYIPIDGPASEVQIVEAKKHLRADPALTIDELVGIAGIVSPQLSASDIELPYTWTPVPAKHVIEWPYGIGPLESMHVTIHPNTCRPLYTIGDETWRQQAERKYGPVEQTVSVHSYYGKYVVAHESFPSKNDFMQYLYDRCVVHSTRHTTLPAPIVQIVDEVMHDYSELAKTTTPVEFSKRWRASVRIEDRIALETS